MTLKPGSFLPLLVPVLLLSGTAHALELDRSGPFRITARQVELDQKTGNVVYQGNVVLMQGDLRILADRIEAKSRQGRPELLLGRGNPLQITARPEGKDEPLTMRAGRLEYHRSTDRLMLMDRLELVRDEMKVEAQRLEYRRAEEQIDIVGNVVLRRGNDVFRAPTMHINLGDNSVSAGSAPGAATRERVTAVLQPRKERP